MPSSQHNITAQTRLGANLAPGGVTFRTWAPMAREVYVALKQPTGTAPMAFPKHPGHLLVKDGQGLWAGFVPGLKDGDLYRFYVVGTGSEGFIASARFSMWSTASNISSISASTP
jgi:1,4-alpha-glucan branching enzyme